MSLPRRTSGVDSLPARLRAALRRHLAPPTIVLLYHRVLPAIARDVNQLAVSTENFAGHLAWLAAHTRSLAVSDLLNSLGHAGASRLTLDSQPRVLLTFDDGYADNVHYALPLLVEHGCRAIVFPVTDLVDTGRPFWWGALEQIIFDGQPPAGGWKLPDGVLVPPYAHRDAMYAILHGALKPLADDLRRTILDNLASQAGVAPHTTDDSRSLNWQELRTWTAAGMQVGAHTRTHAQLSALREDELPDEVAGSKAELERRLGAAVETFAYPFGSKNDFDAPAERAVRDAGFRCAFANRPGHVRWARSRYALPRYLVRNWTADELAACVQTWCRA